MIERIKRISLKYIDEKFNELKDQFIEMGQLKSNFNIEKFTIKKEGNFIAHNFHFLMRQYQLALYESRRMLLDKEEKTRKLKEYCDLQQDEDIITKIKVQTENGLEEKYLDIEIGRLENEIDLLDITMTNKLCMVDYFEKCRVRLVELNGNKAPTNEQYQAEEPEYWEWFLRKKALNQHKQKISGIEQGVWDAVDMFEEVAVLNEKYQGKIGSRININEVEQEIELQKKIPVRLKLIES